MGWIERLQQWWRPPVEPELEARTSLEDLQALIAGPLTATGRPVTTEGALAQATVFACVRLIAESVGMLPHILYRRLPRGKARATEHPLYTVLHDLPNPELTALELYENLTGHLALWGNAYFEIEYDGAGRRRALWPLRPDMVDVRVEGNRRVYDVMLPNGQRVTLDRWRVWHVRGWGTDAWVGKSPIALAREAIGLSIATERYGGTFFGNDSRPGGVLKHPGKLSEQAASRLKTSWESAHGGLEQAHRVAVLEEGIEWQQIGIPPEDAQFLDTRQFQRTEICGIYRVPPHMIADVSGSTSWGTGIEQQAISFTTFTLLPYLTRISQSAGRDLLTPLEQRSMFCEFLTAALVRGDLTARYNAYNVGRMGGWLSVNDIREMENLNPVEDGDGYLQPLNMTRLGNDDNGAEEPGGMQDETQPD